MKWQAVRVRQNAFLSESPRMSCSLLHHHHCSTTYMTTTQMLKLHGFEEHHTLESKAFAEDAMIQTILPSASMLSR